MTGRGMWPAVFRRVTAAGTGLALLATGLVAAQLTAQPAAAITTSSASTIAAGVSHTCTIQSGRAYCWGDNTYGELGNGTTTSSSSPVQVTSGTVAQITTGLYHTCALTALGAAYCWGYGTYGQRGDNNSLTATQSTPAAVITTGVLLGKTLSQISAGTYHTCATDSTGLVYCWGQDSSGSGQVGDNGTATIRQSAVYVYSMTPAGVTAFPGNASATVYWTAPGFLNGTLTTYTATTSPGSFTCTSTSATHCTITGLTNGTTYTVTVTVTTATGTSAASAAATVTPAAGTTSINAGFANSCVLQSGKAYCWGDNTDGEAGNNTTSPVTQLSPVAVHTGGALSGVTLTEVDNGTTTSSGVPVAVSNGGVAASNISAGYFETCGLNPPAGTCCWGNDQYGQLGNGTTGTSVSTPSAVTTSGALSGVTLTQLSVGQGHVCGLSTAGAAYCWGYDAYGQLGNNNGSANALTAVLVSPQAPTGVTATPGSGSATGTLSMATEPTALGWGVTMNGLDSKLIDTTPAPTFFTVNDATGSGAGWNVNVSATNFTTGTKSLASAGSLAFTGSVGSVTSTTAPDGTCGAGTCTAPVNTTTYPVNITTAASSPTPVKIFDTAANSGMGTILVGASNPTSWWLNVPANTYAGTYTSTITWQLTSAP